jgi:hypothetical protein
VIGDLKATATAVGFDPDGEYRGYTSEIFAFFILEDPQVIAELEKNWQREVAGCTQESHPDHVLLATLESFSDLEKAALRRRVWVAFEKWDKEPVCAESIRQDFSAT